MMIRKTLIVTIAFVLLWSVIVNFLPQDLVTFQSQRDRNLILAQDYLYNTTGLHDKRVILGTSLSQRIVLPLLPDNFYNLAFGGQGVFDGLDIVNHIQEKPGVVFIEMNNILKPEGELFTESLFGPFTYNLKKYFPFLQDKNKPVGVLRGLSRPRQEADVDLDIKEDTPENSTAYNAALEQQKNTYNLKPKKKELDLAFQRMRDAVEQLEKEGSTVVFFEMPVHRELCATQRVQTIRQRFFKEFPRDKYLYIKQPNCNNYRTTDGIHLTKASGNRYSIYFKNRVDALSLS